MYVGMSKNLRQRHMTYVRNGSHIADFIEHALRHGNVLWRRILVLVRARPPARCRPAQCRRQAQLAGMVGGTLALLPLTPAACCGGGCARHAAMQGSEQDAQQEEMKCQTVLDYPWNKDQNPNNRRYVYTRQSGGLFGGKVGGGGTSQPGPRTRQPMRALPRRLPLPHALLPCTPPMHGRSWSSAASAPARPRRWACENRLP